MGKTLIIAEKPSVAEDITKVLPGTFSKSKTHYESEQYVVSFALGHLVTIAYPEDIDPELHKWNLESLPILPEEFPLTVLPETKSQFNALVKLIRRKDVDVIINACDAGREGELIFKYILKQATNRSGNNKQIQRLWLQSMTKEAIGKGFAKLRDDQEMLPLEHTALCRSEADWLIGINATRALTCFNSRFGGFRKTPCGRVQTPTLSMLVKRESERREFVSETYWELHAEFQCGDVRYNGVWIDPAFEKNKTHERRNRIWQNEKTLAIIKRCQGQPATVEESSKKSTKGSPPLYDLTLLQREANSRFGFSAKNTLAIAQALYERHKLLTYPRTDSRCLPEDYLPTVQEVVKLQEGWQYGQFATEALKKGYLKIDKRIFDNKKISDHFAIIPTTGLPSSLSEAEMKVYRMIVQRFLAVFFPTAVYGNTRRVSVAEGETFLTEGKILLEPGWKAIYGATNEEEGEKELQALPLSSQILCASIEQQELQTKPPPRFNEASLLFAMENSGKLVEDEELAEAMKERGLGTPATRASIIEKLINDKYVVREQRDLAPTGKAFELLGLLEASHIDVLASPELTGEWEYKLNQILKGSMTRPQFMKEIRDMTSAIIAKVKSNTSTERREAAFSPVDGQRFYETVSAFESEDKKLLIRKVLGGRVMQTSEVLALIQGETLGPFADFRSKKGKTFTASLRIKDSKVEFIFADFMDNLDLPSLMQQDHLGLSPIDGSKVFAAATGFFSESALTGDQEKGLRISRMILGRQLEEEHIRQLLNQGRTELIQGFISKKKKSFDAFLLLDKHGKLHFEFPPRRKKEAEAKKDA